MGLVDNIKIITGKKTENNGIQSLPNPTTTKKVLVVEDEDILLQGLEAALKQEGFQVVKAKNGQEGLQVAMAEKPDLILLDILMPVMNGTTMLSKLREIPEFKKLPVIMLTNAGTVDNIRESVTYDSASAFLIKSNTSIKEIVEKAKATLYI
jgi:two-component system, OmpR family, alkaline phosphatase synthesis response regulator PhoP